ncbi:MAG: heme-copper oxidase subunit III [Chloroflexota bacterium]|nr:MAG: heme-copper oxidase subunit III [Chloroflexota bacterium]
MTTHTESAPSYQFKTQSNRIGLWLFILSDSFVFAGLLVSRFYLYSGVRPELNQVIGLIVTLMLLVSSFFMNRAEIAAAAGDQRAFLRNLLVTITLGTLFLIGVVGVEWQIAPFSPSDSALGSLFYTMTGFHAFHVLTGVIFMLIVFRNGRKGLYTAEKHWPVEAAAVYWHFVDVVWIFFYPALYLMGRVLG